MLCIAVKEEVASPTMFTSYAAIYRVIKMRNNTLFIINCNHRQFVISAHVATMISVISIYTLYIQRNRTVEF